MKKIAFLLAVCLCLSVCLVGCSNEDKTFLKDPTQIESLDYSDFVIATGTQLYRISDTLMSNSQVGTQADMEKADYIENIFKDIGLRNVNKVPVMLNSWNFSNITLTVDCNCADKTEVSFRVMGTYPCNYSFDNTPTNLIYVDIATELSADLIKDKGIIVEAFKNTDIVELEKFVYQIMQYNPTFVVISMIYEDFYAYEVNTNYFKDITCPLFSIPYSSYKNLKSYLSKSTTTPKSLNAKITGYATISSDLKESYFVVGEIKGNSDKCIYVTAHRDTLHGGFMESNISVGQVAAIASRMVSEGYTPDYTIKFMITTGQEWGTIGEGENAGIEAFVANLSEDEKKNIKGVLVFNGSYPMEYNVYTTTLISNSEDLLKNITKLNTEYYEVYESLQNINEVIEYDLDKVGLTEAEVWSNLGIPTVLCGETNTGRYYQQGTSEDIDAYSIDVSILNFITDYYTNVIKIMSEK